jgi:hypothetical protein
MIKRRFTSFPTSLSLDYRIIPAWGWDDSLQEDRFRLSTGKSMILKGFMPFFYSRKGGLHGFVPRAFVSFRGSTLVGYLP